MSLTTRALTTAGAVAVALGTLAAPASASTGPICRQVALSGENVVQFCVTVEANASGTTVAPYLRITCGIGTNIACALLPISVGTTGFVPNLSYPLPTVDPATLTVHVYAGTVGTLWLDGTGGMIVVPELCIGDPNVC
jgi:hypothetical protein